MHELPEVETLCRQLKDVISGKKILTVKIRDTKLGSIENLTGRKVLFPYRRGKGLNIMLFIGVRSMIFSFRGAARSHNSQYPSP